MRNIISHALENHAVKALFNLHVIDHSASEVILGFRLREEFAAGIPEGGLGSIVDAVVRATSHEPVGQCVLAECEINCYAPLQGREFIASARLGAADEQNAAYYCAVFAPEGTGYKLVAESQGTIYKKDDHASYKNGDPTSCNFNAMQATESAVNDKFVTSQIEYLQ